MKSTAIVTVSVALVMFGAVRTAAQDAPAPDLPRAKRPVGPVVVDARASFPKFDQDANVAAGIGVTNSNLPTRTIGFVGGVHWYPPKLGPIALGLGGELMFAGADRTLDPATEGANPGPTVNTHFSTVSPQVSINFGSREGWSYISGGLGWSKYTVERADAPLADPAPRTRTVNYGGGARWFSKRHIGVSLDLRFYTVDAQVATAARPAYPQMRMMVINAGVAFK
jgi:hypothetical protein